jgi:hypothetical protein
MLVERCGSSSGIRDNGGSSYLVVLVGVRE